jgi:hypothetical protein
LVVFREELEEVEEERKEVLLLFVSYFQSSLHYAKLYSYLNSIPRAFHAMDNPAEDERPDNNACYQNN